MEWFAAGFSLPMAVLDNHSWQYAQAGKTLIRLSGRVLFIINVFCYAYPKSCDETGCVVKK